MKILKKNKEVRFLEKYFNDYVKIIEPNQDILLKLKKVKEILISASKNNGKILIFGNGGSAEIDSNFSLDITKNARVRCVNYNESDLLTCFSNDFGYEKWVEKCIEYYGDEEDIGIFISAGGNSENMLNGAKKAKEKKFSKIITFTGNDKDNKLSKLGDINFWIDSRAYNLIENAHQALLLSLVDLIIGKSEYPPN